MKNDFKKMISYISGAIYISDEIKKIDEDILLHISDTPSTIYKGLDLLIKELKPNIEGIGEKLESEIEKIEQKKIGSSSDESKTDTEKWLEQQKKIRKDN